MSSFEEYLELTKLLSNISFTSSDGDSGRAIANEVVSRDKKYSELLNSYTSITKWRLVLKEIHKWLFFWLIAIACFCVARLAYRLISQILAADDPRLIVDAVPAILTAFTAFVSTVIVVPLAITNFLFNTKEDDNITSLIQHTQQHDTTSIQMLKERFVKESHTAKPNTSTSKPVDVTDD